MLAPLSNLPTGWLDKEACRKLKKKKNWAEMQKETPPAEMETLNIHSSSKFNNRQYIERNPLDHVSCT